MEQIDFNTIDFSKLTRIKNVISSESNLYYKGKILYKIFKPMPKDELKFKELKIECLHEMNDLGNVVLPDIKIVDNINLAGYITDYLNDMLSLYNYRYICNSYSYYVILIKLISSTLKDIHNHNCLVTDFSFDNIMFGSKFKYAFVDADGWTVNNIYSLRISQILYNFLEYKNIVINQEKYDTNMDKLSFILSYLNIIFDSDIQHVDRYDFDKNLDIIGFHDEVKTLLRNILDKNPLKLDLPYIGDVIDINNNYCFTLKQ